MDEWWLPLLESDGLLLRDRALANVDPDRLLVALRSGRLKRLQRGVYRPRLIDPTPLRLARAAVISSGLSDAVASHTTAARVHGIELAGSAGPEHVTVGLPDRRRDRKDLLFHCRSLATGEVVVHEGVPITSGPRTVADLACGDDRVHAVWAIDDALRRGLCSRAEVDSVIAGWRGGGDCVLARNRLQLADGLAESVLETAGRLAIVDSGLPAPVAQYEVRREGDGSVLARLDGAYVAERIGLEFDGRSVHEAPEALLRDRRRQNSLVERGWTMLRFTWWDVMSQPASFIATVRGALVQRRMG